MELQLFCYWWCQHYRLFADTPPLLFEASSLENAFQIGGYPWHYIITPNKKKHKGVFHICSLKDKALVIYLDSGFSEMNVYHVCLHLFFWLVLLTCFPVWCSHRDHPTVLHLLSTGVMCKIFSWELVLFPSFQYNRSTLSATQLCMLSLRVKAQAESHYLIPCMVTS